MISQIRLFDKKRISSRLGKVSTSDFEKVKKAVQALFD
jgi:mRNA-degrading endonuclease toxin of MazEF toxin-antitoxin module